jgi:hypothetical protein
MTYTSIRDAAAQLSLQDKQKYNLYVLTGECTAPKQSRGQGAPELRACTAGRTAVFHQAREKSRPGLARADWYSVLKVTDPTLVDDEGEQQRVAWQDVQVFAQSPAKMPQPARLHDIIRLHRVQARGGQRLPLHLPAARAAAQGRGQRGAELADARRARRAGAGVQWQGAVRV